MTCENESNRTGCANCSGAATRILKSLEHKLYTQNMMGNSKHAAKHEARINYIAEHGDLVGWNPTKVEGIFSRNTLTTYLNEMPAFAQFCAECGAKRLGDLTETMGEDYLRAKFDGGKSAWSITTASAAINKAMGWELSPSKLGLPIRSKEHIARSRIPRAHDQREFTGFEKQITMAKGTGIRRMSVTTMVPNDFIRNSDGVIIGVRVKEKGGRQRVAPVLNDYRKVVTEIVDDAALKNGGSAPIFDKYDIHIDNHSFRAEYAAALLHQLEQERAADIPLFGGAYSLDEYCHLTGKDRNRKEKTAGHDTDLLGAVSGALGHNRIEVVLRHYLYRY